jgi:hypothetical protein
MTNAWTFVRDTSRWHVTSQQGARRNALVASTQLADRRRERIDAEEFLGAYLAKRESAARRDTTRQPA